MSYRVYRYLPRRSATPPALSYTLEYVGPGDYYPGVASDHGWTPQQCAIRDVIAKSHGYSLVTGKPDSFAANAAKYINGGTPVSEGTFVAIHEWGGVYSVAETFDPYAESVGA